MSCEDNTVLLYFAGIYHCEVEGKWYIFSGIILRCLKASNS